MAAGRIGIDHVQRTIHAKAGCVHVDRKHCCAEIGSSRVEGACHNDVNARLRHASICRTGSTNSSSQSCSKPSRARSAPGATASSYSNSTMPAGTVRARHPYTSTVDELCRCRVWVQSWDPGRLSKLADRPRGSRIGLGFEGQIGLVLRDDAVMLLSSARRPHGRIPRLVQDAPKSECVPMPSLITVRTARGAIRRSNDVPVFHGKRKRR